MNGKKIDVFGENLPQCTFFHHYQNKHCTGTKSGLQRLEASYCTGILCRFKNFIHTVDYITPYGRFVLVNLIVPHLIDFPYFMELGISLPCS